MKNLLAVIAVLIGLSIYLVHAFAGSRAGIKSVLIEKEMNKEGDKLISDAVLISYNCGERVVPAFSE